MLNKISNSDSKILKTLIAAVSELRMPGNIRKKLNDLIFDLTKEYREDIPLQQIDLLLRNKGFLLIQEDGTPWSGFLTGREGRAAIDIGLLSTGQDGVFQEVTNSNLVLTWHKMDVSGNYEVVAYLS